MSKPVYHYPKSSNYTSALCGQWSIYTMLKVTKASPTCKKCLKKLAEKEML